VSEALTLRKQIHDKALLQAAAKIRAEWVCSCVDDHPMDNTKWHECCKYSEWAARNVESLLIDPPLTFRRVGPRAHRARPVGPEETP